MEVKRYTIEFDVFTGEAERVECPNGDYVEHKDYKHLSDYCDRLVEVSKLPCLPKDLENLRDANAKFAQEVQDLRSTIDELDNEIVGWKNKWTCAIEMAAKAENECDRLEEKYHEAIELRNKWHAKWQTARNECITKVDAVKQLLDDIANKA